jgi:hypothetical protein
VVTVAELQPIFRQMGEGVAKQVRAWLAPRDVRLDGLEKRIAEIEARQKEFAHKGVWQSGTVYRAGNFVADSGSCWACIRDTTQRPGTPDSGWILTAKRGADGRDARA